MSAFPASPWVPWLFEVVLLCRTSSTACPGVHCAGSKQHVACEHAHAWGVIKHAPAVQLLHCPGCTGCIRVLLVAKPEKKMLSPCIAAVGLHNAELLLACALQALSRWQARLVA